MGMIGTFDGFTTARLGIYAAQHGLRVTGNNISNINTSGYTRQRIDQSSLKTGSNDMYRSLYDNHVGNGALVTGINQVRDPYLDIRFRDTNSSVGYTDTMLAGLKEIASVLDEVGKGVDSVSTKKGDGLLYAQLQDVFKSLEQLSANPTVDNDTLVRNSAASLVQLFNTYADGLEKLRQGMEDSFKQEVSSVNEILTNIRNLNEQIRRSDVNGDNALEMRDERNRQIDALSEHLSISVEYSMEDIGAGKEVEKLIIRLGDANPDPTVKTDEIVLIDGIYGSQLELTENDPYYTLSATRLEDGKGRVPLDTNRQRPKTELKDNDLGGALQAQRELLTEKGEFATAEDVARDPKATTKRGIQYYQLSLDLLARKFAEAYNDLNQGHAVDENGDPIPGFETKPGIDGNGQVWDCTSNTYVAAPTGVDPAADWELSPDGYYVDKATGEYVGVHNGCNLVAEHIKPGDSDEKKLAAAQAYGCNTWEEFLGAHGVPGNVKIPTGEDMKLGGPLFSNRNDGDDTDNITAANISISHSWSTGAIRIVPTFVRLFDGTVTNSTQNENVDHMISKINESLDYDPNDLYQVPTAVGKKLFSGSFNDMYSNMCSVLGNDQRIANVQLNTNYTSLVELDSSREGVSGVDLNDEAMNMMQFQKAYSAACRLMTAIDEAIDRLINNTGIVGR